MDRKNFLTTTAATSLIAVSPPKLALAKTPKVIVPEFIDIDCWHEAYFSIRGQRAQIIKQCLMNCRFLAYTPHDEMFRLFSQKFEAPKFGIRAFGKSLFPPLMRFQKVSENFHPEHQYWYEQVTPDTTKFYI